MPRLRAELSGQRLRELVDAAWVVFCRRGFERSQMADVAKEMGVAVGTVYLYVESKDALFDLVVRDTAAEDRDWLDGLEIPVPAPRPGATLDFLREVFGREGEWPRLDAALDERRAEDPVAELRGILDEQYELMRRHRKGLQLLLRSALEFPGLSEVFVLGLRAKLLEALERYLELRVEAGQFRRPKHRFATAAVIAQTLAWANLQRPWDPGLQGLDDATVKEATLDLLAYGLIEEKDAQRASERATRNAAT